MSRGLKASMISTYTTEIAMFGNMGCHIIEFPSKRWGFVGSVPTALCTEVPATTADVLRCRTHRNEQGELVTWKTPVFETREEAVSFAASKGVEVKG